VLTEYWTPFPVVAVTVTVMETGIRERVATETVTETSYESFAPLPEAVIGVAKVRCVRIRHQRCKSVARALPERYHDRHL
jgi:hypothetical protein